MGSLRSDNSSGGGSDTYKHIEGGSAYEFDCNSLGSCHQEDHIIRKRTNSKKKSNFMNSSMDFCSLGYGNEGSLFNQDFSLHAPDGISLIDLRDPLRSDIIRFINMDVKTYYTEFKGRISTRVEELVTLSKEIEETKENIDIMQNTMKQIVEKINEIKRKSAINRLAPL